MWRQGVAKAFSTVCSETNTQEVYLFVVAPIGCFLRKLLRPVRAKVESESTEYFDVLSIYIKLNLCLAGHFLLPGLSFRFSRCAMRAVRYTCLHSLERQHSTGENRRACCHTKPRRATSNRRWLLLFFRQSELRGLHSNFYHQELFGCRTEQPVPTVLMPKVIKKSFIN